MSNDKVTDDKGLYEAIRAIDEELATPPATQEAEITRYGWECPTGGDIVECDNGGFVLFDDHIARIRAEREAAIRECAEVATAMPVLRKISEAHVAATRPNDVAEAILALLAKHGGQS